MATTSSSEAPPAAAVQPSSRPSGMRCAGHVCPKLLQEGRSSISKQPACSPRQPLLQAYRPRQVTSSCSARSASTVKHVRRRPGSTSTGEHDISRFVALCKVSADVRCAQRARSEDRALVCQPSNNMKRTPHLLAVGACWVVPARGAVLLPQLLVLCSSAERAAGTACVRNALLQRDAS